MRLRNKKTGEIHEITEVGPLHDMDKKFVIYSQTEGHNYAYKNLAELNAEWEDMPEEPKEYWYINSSGEINSICEEYEEEEDTNLCKEIGNYFETKEEAEQAVEKLKAWKRLKDKGFRFDGWNVCDSGKGITIFANYPSGTKAYLDLLFGGEE